MNIPALVFFAGIAALSSWKERKENWRRMLLGVRESPARPGDIHARNYMEAIQKAGREGTTIEGAVYKTMTHVGKNRWRAGVEKFNDK